MRKEFGLLALLGAALVAACGGGDDGTGTGGAGASTAAADCFDPKPGCVLASDSARVTDPNVPFEDQEALALGNASFAMDIEREFTSPTKNVLFSPYSISTALAMTYAGARGATETAMAATMHFDLPQAKLHPAFNYMDLQLKSREASPEGVTGGGFRLHTANALWSQIGLGIEQPFLKTMVENYGARVRLADFMQVKQAEALINKWVSDQTAGKIPDLLSGNLNEETQLVLVNAIYFDAAWTEPFEKSATKPGSFTNGGGSSVMTDMMHGTQSARYGSDPAWEAVELTYAGTPMSMIVVMPTAGTADAFEKTLDGASFKTINESLTTHSVDITMPKFSFEFSASLKEALMNLGMTVAFNENADFSGILSGGGLLIQDVIHKAVISVDEEGTEAAAATAVILGSTGSGLEPEPAAITIDHPFFFFITDQPTGALLFAGRVNDPSVH